MLIALASAWKQPLPKQKSSKNETEAGSLEYQYLDTVRRTALLKKMKAVATNDKLGQTLVAF
jgi:hypothetical protein